MSEHHKFRYLLPPGNNFHFVSKFKAWLLMSFVLMAIVLALVLVYTRARGTEDRV